MSTGVGVGARLPRPPRTTRRGAGTGRRLWAAALLLAVVVGLAVRIGAMLGDGGQLNSDEAIEGLLAVHLLDHHTLPAFFWGQWYGGTAEAVAVAAVMNVVGRNAAAIQLVQYAEGFAQALLVWRIGLRVLDRQRALLAAALVWAWPAAFVLLQARPYLFYEITVCCGLLVLLMTLRVVARPADRWSWVALGLAAGVGFWSSPQSLYYLLAAGGLLLVRLRTRSLRYGWPALPAGLLGASPWLVSNIVHGWRSLLTNSAVTDGPLDRLRGLVWRGGPMAFGTRIPITEQWVVPGAVLLYVAFCAAVLFAFRPSVHRSPLHLLVLPAFVLVYGLVPVLAAVTNGRYFIFLGAPLALALASVARTRRSGAALLAGCALLTVVAVARIPPPERFLLSTRPVTAMLTSEGVARAYSGYWTAYKLSWESRETVIASPMTFVRYHPYDRQVAATPRVALIYNSWANEQAAARVLRTWLQATGTPYAEKRVNGYTVFLPDRHLERGQLPAGAAVVP